MNYFIISSDEIMSGEKLYVLHFCTSCSKVMHDIYLVQAVVHQMRPQTCNMERRIPYVNRTYRNKILQNVHKVM
jgi:hypothetical protein